jgi:putative PIN family toxin of toxin-antitoxin system
MRGIVVFDTNILFSGVGWKGKPFRCLELARAGMVDGVTCREVLDELAEKLQTKLSFTPEQTLDTVADLLTFLRVVPITGKLKVVPADPDDDKVLECAAVVGATHTITGDRRHLLPLGTFQGIPILTAADFLAVTAPP